MKSENRVDDKTDKPTGSRILMKFINLLPDTIFEFRVAYRNQRGLSEYSLPSRRAKTNRARLPGLSAPPSLTNPLALLHLHLHTPSHLAPIHIHIHPGG